ncbi:MAG: GatB/YqeY domain-containing protein [Pseudorhodobacter sp.]|nr:GatB/YqeY domain-containing protein [Pseudorhodobacter sp.]
MSIRERLQAEIKDAMRAKAAERLSGLRLILGAIKDREIALRGEGGAEMTEADILPILGKMVKQRQESVRLYVEGGREDLAQKERNEITVIEEFLPAQLSPAEVEGAIAAAVSEVGATSVKDMGRVMAVLKAKYTGQMDFGAVGALIKSRLA